MDKGDRRRWNYVIEEGQEGTTPGLGTIIVTQWCLAGGGRGYTFCETTVKGAGLTLLSSAGEAANGQDVGMGTRRARTRRARTFSGPDENRVMGTKFCIDRV